jgi:hypothetical protein
MSHRDGCGAVTGTAAARREGPAGREGCARSRRRPALHSPAGSSLQKSYTHVTLSWFRRGDAAGTKTDVRRTSNSCITA